uniref:ASTRA-associated protein 1 n=1 Tax=Bionectria ochroleuca TaxID=29856 RepID=A0A8H7N6N0_BIOOC
MAEHNHPTPKNILRGHKAQVHAAAFLRHNSRLATGDADGFVVLWDLTIMRPKAVWRAHENAILGIRSWGHDKVITHGRDHKLIVWKIAEDDEQRLSTTLPLEETPVPRPAPWMLHLLEVNTMNFCAFGATAALSDSPASSFNDASEILIAVPNTIASEQIDIYELPSQKRMHTVQPGKDNGMAMSVALANLEDSLLLVAAFENGYASVHRLDPDGGWTMTYRSQAHTQPILSLAIHPTNKYFITSSADAIVAKHPLPLVQQDGMAVLDPDNRIIEEIDDLPIDTPPGPSLLSAQLGGSSGKSNAKSKAKMTAWEHPHKVANTKHSGQQSLKIRSDGKIFATAGWDGNFRIYSCKTLKELAVLQWHKVGCYAVAFADLDSDSTPEDTPEATAGNTNQDRRIQILNTPTVKERRVQQAKTTHWVAGGAKDGKVSLWDVY